MTPPVELSKMEMDNLRNKKDLLEIRHKAIDFEINLIRELIRARAIERLNENDN